MTFDWLKAHETFERVRLMLYCLGVVLLAITTLPWLLTDAKHGKTDWAIQRNLNALDRAAWDLTQILAPHYASDDAKTIIRRKLDGYLSLREDLTHVVFQLEEDVIYRFSTSDQLRGVTKLLLDIPPGEFRPHDIPELDGIDRESFYGVSRQAFAQDGTVAGVLVLAISLESLVQETSDRTGKLALLTAALLLLAAVASVWMLYLLITCPREDI